LKVWAERRAEEAKKAMVGEDVDNDAMKEVFGAAGFAESDLRYVEAVEKFIDQLCEETFGDVYDAISGEVLGGELINKAREVEMQMFKKHGAYGKVPLEECWRVTGAATVGVGVGVK
jgi:hypothetical protein